MAKALYTMIRRSFAANILAGAGTVVQASYQIPVGRVAELETFMITVSPGAAHAFASAQVVIDVINPGAPGNVIYGIVITTGVLAALGLFGAPHAVLRGDNAAQDTVRLISTNVSAINISMSGYYQIKEYRS